MMLVVKALNSQFRVLVSNLLGGLKIKVISASHFVEVH